MITNNAPTVVTDVPGAPAERGRRLDALVLGCIGWLISFLGSWIPSYSFDETISMSMIHRTPAQLWQVLDRIDAVHGLYYFLLQGWAAAFGDSRIVTRLISSIAIGGAVALTALVVRRLSTRTVAVSSGVILILLPRAEWAATQARSYGITAFAFALMLWLFVLAAQWRKTWLWVAYGAAVAASGVVFAYLVVVPVTLVLTAVMLHRYRRSWMPGSIAGIVGILAAVPVLKLVSDQRGQVDWIAPISRATVSQITSEQWFLGDSALRWTFAVLVIAGVATEVVRRATGRGSTDVSALGFGAVPPILATAAIVAVSVIVTPVYSPRYLTFTTPALAIVGGWAVGALVPVLRSIAGRGKRTAQVVLTLSAILALALGVVAAAPGYLVSRTPYSNQSDYSQAADWIASHAHVGDAAFYARPGYPADMHVVQFASFSDLASLEDVMTSVPPQDNDSYWGRQYPFSDFQRKLAGHDRVFIVSTRAVPFTGSDVYLELATLHFSVDSTWVGPYTMVVLATR